MVTKTTDDVLKNIEGIVRELVQGKSTNELVFGPIHVIAHDDYWDEERVFIYVVYDGDPKKLDFSWTIGLVDRILQRIPEGDLPIVPVKHFIHKSEWDKFRRYNIEPWIQTTS